MYNPNEYLCANNGRVQMCIFHPCARVDHYNRSDITSACTRNVADILGSTMHAKMRVNRNRKCHRKRQRVKKIEREKEREKGDTRASSTPLIRDRDSARS